MGWAYDKVYEGPRQPPPSLDEMVKVQEEYESPMVEAVAKAIYDAETEDYEMAMEETRRVWKLTPEVPWDSDDREIGEWERDEYRTLAVAAIKTMKQFMEMRQG